MNEQFTAPAPPEQSGGTSYQTPTQQTSAPQPIPRKRPVENNNTGGASRPFKIRKPTERTFSEKLTQIIPESKLYNELLETEKKIDSIMLRKRLECQDARGKSSRIHRTVRVFISNTTCFQPWSQNETSSQNPTDCRPSWTLKIEGRMLDIPAVHSKHKHSNRKFSTLVKSLVVELDPSLYPDGYLVEWSPSAELQEVDGFEIKRFGNVDVRAKIILQMNCPQDRFLPSPDLRELIGISHEAPVSENEAAGPEKVISKFVTKADVITHIWNYVKFRDLQDKNDKLTIVSDELLFKIFKFERIAFSQLPFLIHNHLLPPEPVVFDYLIRVDKLENNSSIAFDIEIETDDEYRSKVTSVIGNNATNRAIYNLDEKIAQIMTSITNAKIKREFLNDFVSSPVDFINRWVASQAQDLEVLYGDTQVNLEESRMADFYNQDWAKESVLHYFSTKSKENLANSVAKHT